MWKFMKKKIFGGVISDIEQKKTFFSMVLSIMMKKVGGLKI